MLSIKSGKKTFYFIAVLLLAISGCVQTGENEKDPNRIEEDKTIIGFAMDTLVHERWLRDREVFAARANELGAEVIVQTANSDSAEQEKQVQYLLDQGIDVLVLVPHDAEQAANIVRMAKGKGVKVISYDRLVRNANADLYISFDNIKVGELMGSAVINEVPTGNYLILNGSQSDNNSFLLNEGYKGILEDQISNGQVRLVGETWIKDWLYENAVTFVEEIVASGERIDAVIAANDTLAGAAVNVLAENRLADQVTIVGHDADLDGCQRVVEGTQLATVYKPIDQLAKATAEYAVALAKGGTVQTKERIYDGKYDIPYHKIDPILVTNENMVEVIIEERFHRLESVYMNVPKSEWPQIP